MKRFAVLNEFGVMLYELHASQLLVNTGLVEVIDDDGLIKSVISLSKGQQITWVCDVVGAERLAIHAPN